MSAASLRAWPAIFAAGLMLVLPAGCAVEGGGYDGGYGYGADYYEPSGAIYGGWGDGYYVGPYREGFRHDVHDHGDFHGGAPHGGSVGARPFRAAPAGHAMPSIPSHARGGGHVGGGRR